MIKAHKLNKNCLTKRDCTSQFLFSRNEMASSIRHHLIHGLIYLGIIISRLDFTDDLPFLYISWIKGF